MLLASGPVRVTLALVMGLSTWAWCCCQQLAAAPAPVDQTHCDPKRACHRAQDEPASAPADQGRSCQCEQITPAVAKGEVLISSLALNELVAPIADVVAIVPLFDSRLTIAERSPPVPRSVAQTLALHCNFLN